MRSPLPEIKPKPDWAWPSAAGLPQRDVSPDGIRSSSSRSAGLSKPPSDEVTVWVVVSNPQSPVRAADIAMTFAYTDDRGVEIEPPQVDTSSNEIAAGSTGRIGKTFWVQQVSRLFRSRRLRVELAVLSYPIITFSGENP
jgi:hypothetical protein